MYDVSVPMALADFIPVLLFGWTAVLLQRDLYGKMPKYAFACLAAGAVDAFLAGFLKALWKLLYAAGICDFQLLNTIFLPMQSLGLLLTGFGLILMLTARRSFMAAAAPPVFAGTFLFIGMMVAGFAAICASLSVIAVRTKKGFNVILFVLSFCCYLAMGYLSSRDAASAAVNWSEEGVNTLGQLLLLCGTLSLHKAGLRERETV